MATLSQKYDRSRFIISDIHFHAETDEIDEDGVFIVGREGAKDSQFPEYLPTWDPKQKFSKSTFFEHEDPGLRADPSLPNLFPKKNEVLKNITPKLGSVVTGVQLSELNDSGKDELALFVAERGVVVFREQDWATRGPAFITEYGRHFGPLHVHPTSGAPRGFHELHVTYRRADEKEFERTFAQKTNMVAWHSDATWERQPPGTTFFAVLEGPEAGGDTIFADNAEAYDRLSPAFQQRLERLHALHSSISQSKNSLSHGGIERRSHAEHIHPLVRIHPVTKKKSIFINRPFTKRIVELKEEESDDLLKFLYKHIESAHDLQLRVKWEPGTVVVWDNRNTSHSAIIDWDAPVSRHAVRVTPLAERPTASLEDLNKAKPEFGDLH